MLLWLPCAPTSSVCVQTRSLPQVSLQITVLIHEMLSSIGYVPAMYHRHSHTVLLCVVAHSGTRFHTMSCSLTRLLTDFPTQSLGYLLGLSHGSHPPYPPTYLRSNVASGDAFLPARFAAMLTRAVFAVPNWYVSRTWMWIQ